MSTTTSLKLPEALKKTIAQVALMEGKTPHALMVETLQTAMDDAVLREKFYADGEASHAETLATNRVYRADDVKSYVLARIQGRNPKRPKPVPLDPTKPMSRG